MCLAFLAFGADAEAEADAEGADAIGAEAAAEADADADGAAAKAEAANREATRAAMILDMMSSFGSGLNRLKKTKIQMNLSH